MSKPTASWRRHLPFLAHREIERLRAENAALRAQQADWARFFPPGHFYSPLPSRDEVAEAFARGGFGPPFPGIDLNEAGQAARLERFAAFYAEQPFPEEPAEGRRFFLKNPSYGHFDAIMLWCMLREARPRRIVEVGSGFSSAAMLDLNDHVFGGGVHLTFIDPDMARLRPLLRPGDESRTTLIEKRVQEVPLDPFRALGENDVLFIDSSHVSKIGSDVNRLFFDVLPALAPGVLIHIHDVAGNLEYPREWLDEGRAWNEQYLLRAFLMNNRDYRIELFSGWLFNTRHAWFREKMPLCARGGGGQIWLRKLA
ncbi:MAG: class I SAM-dependent methyltransferase [Opitutaceae bacterium]|nr:class I SAM-dependent methyltransferase [Opitutaceae bacterium]